MLNTYSSIIWFVKITLFCTHPCILYFYLYIFQMENFELTVRKFCRILEVNVNSYHSNYESLETCFANVQSYLIYIVEFIITFFFFRLVMQSSVCFQMKFWKLQAHLLKQVLKKKSSRYSFLLCYLSYVVLSFQEILLASHITVFKPDTTNEKLLHVYQDLVDLFCHIQVICICIFDFATIKL